MISINEIDSIKNNLIKDFYPELKGVKISCKSKRGKGFFMQTYLFPYLIYLFFGYRIEIHKSSLKMNNEAFTGCLAHELEHISYQHRKRKGIFDTPDQDERIIDQLLINRGLGDKLLKFIEYHNSKFKKYNKNDGLTEKEVRKQLKLV